MSNTLLGNELTRAMLERGDEQVWCAVSNESHEHAMGTIRDINGDFIVYIVGFENECFLCKEGGAWKYAVPIKKTPLTQVEVGL